jgi:endonuclease YncB( thermonuclease family)
VWPGLDITTKVRLRGIDAPEMNGRCAAERVKADAARAALASILAEGQVGILRVGLDKYGGRVVADASTRKTADVSTALLDGGLVRSYAGGRRESWCGSQQSAVGNQ